MTPLQKFHSFGNHVIIGVSGTVLNDEDKRILSKLKPVGIIFFAKNFRQDTHYEDWLDTFKQLTEQIREYTERKSMLMSIDHEGGRVVRTPSPITRFPYAFLQSKAATKIAKATALELKSLGINLSWAPVADIFSNPNNPIIGPRAFNTTPETAAKSACKYFIGLKESEIIACAKHFPGHGDTSTDSHLELPVLDLSLEQLRNRELIPFQALIEAGIPTIMTAHILFPQIDKNLPATLSQNILRQTLREELGFEGVVVSDDLDMKAVSDMYANKNISANNANISTVAQTFNAGCDLLIISGNLPASSPEKIYGIAEDFVTSLENGSLSETVIAAAKTRIDKLLAIAPQYSPHILDRNTLLQHAELAISCAYGG
ncbi:beta-N-acetylhexosaminidase [Mastigocoleus testarum]|uniref:Glycoside hydrolase n=1 Tax=Mastigocoleus testarum BC008 TaxID=371196 RepID=A0A0V7ZKM7_9CYAN|nr:beta-N-acetylhexosaminidase [Mastigocoleus testarum]KST65204.1 glycoside hydrolase [Mastigocoleus testarum BC008]KST69621.1 glycoside hydrolase [Mastigocoleus testarum BC008]